MRQGTGTGGGGEGIHPRTRGSSRLGDAGCRCSTRNNLRVHIPVPHHLGCLVDDVQDTCAPAHQAGRDRQPAGSRTSWTSSILGLSL